MPAPADAYGDHRTTPSRRGRRDGLADATRRDVPVRDLVLALDRNGPAEAVVHGRGARDDPPDLLEGLVVGVRAHRDGGRGAVEAGGVGAGCRKPLRSIALSTATARPSSSTRCAVACAADAPAMQRQMSRVTCSSPRRRAGTARCSHARPTGRREQLLDRGQRVRPATARWRPYRTDYLTGHLAAPGAECRRPADAAVEVGR
jgi:hypothetical protein